MPPRIFCLIAAALFCAAPGPTGGALPVRRCDPAGHICEGRCPAVPGGATLPAAEDPAGLCLKEAESGACVCWLTNPSPDAHLQTLFKCEVAAQNGSAVRHVMCLPPSICFPPGPGCLIVPHCPCAHHGRTTPPDLGGWRSVVAFILRSRTPVLPTAPDTETATERPPSEAREFGVKHLLFLLAFVIGPLLCWCLLTFFHEGKCRRKRPSPEAEPMTTDRAEGDASTAPAPQVPTAPKLESPPPYGEAAEPGEACPLEMDCGPPPSYEDAVREQWPVRRAQDLDSE